MVSRFAQRAYALLREVPPGAVTTYGDLAQRIKSSPRAVGSVLRINPYAPQVPCHRVVGSDGSIGGFNGSKTGPDVARKIRLLQREGVMIRQRRVVGFDRRRHRF